MRQSRTAADVAALATADGATAEDAAPPPLEALQATIAVTRNDRIPRLRTVASVLGGQVPDEDGLLSAQPAVSDECEELPDDHGTTWDGAGWEGTTLLDAHAPGERLQLGQIDQVGMT